MYVEDLFDKFSDEYEQSNQMGKIYGTRKIENLGNMGKTIFALVSMFPGEIYDNE